MVSISDRIGVVAAVTSGGKRTLLMCAAVNLVAGSGDDVTDDWYEVIDYRRGEG